jgi:hypothetical protein
LSKRRTGCRAQERDEAQDHNSLAHGTLPFSARQEP